MYEVIAGKDISVLQGCGLGGGSLINANVALDTDPKVYQTDAWPKEFRDDLKHLNGIDKERFYRMLCPTPYPDTYPELAKMKALHVAAKGLGIVDIEDLDKIYHKMDL